MRNNEENETVARRLFEEVWQNHNYEVIDELLAEDYVIHDRSMPQGTEWASGPDGYRLMAEMWHGFFDGPVELDQLIPAGSSSSSAGARPGSSSARWGPSSRRRRR